MIAEQIRSAFQDPLLNELLWNDACLATLIYGSGERRYENIDQQDSQQLTFELQKFALAQGIRIDPIRPFGGSVWFTDNQRLRWHLVIPPMAGGGPLFSVRRMGLEALQPEDFGPNLKRFAAAEQKSQAADLVFFGGETGAGKTSCMTTLAVRGLLQERVCIVETVSEILKVSPHWIQLVSQRENLQQQGAISCSTLIEESLRLRPDRYILGEIRGEEAAALLGLTSTASAGIWTTIHTATPDHLIPRLSFLSSISQEEWRQTFSELAVVYCQLQRGAPRLKAVYEWVNGGWQVAA